MEHETPSETPIARLLRLRGISGAELGRRIGVGETQVSKWRNGLRVSERKQREITRKLKLSDDELDELGWGVESRV